MKKSKLSLILALAIMLALVTPFVTYATNSDAGEVVVTSAPEGEAVTTSETSGDAVQTSDTSDGTATISEGSETTEPSSEGEEGTDSDDSTSTEENLEEVQGNYYEQNTNLVFNKAVDGNVFLLGDTVTIKGKVNGDLYVCAKDVVLDKSAQVYGNFFIVANNFTHSGLIYNLYAVVNNYTCEYDGLTALDLRVFAKNIKYSGYIERTAYFSAENIELTDDAYILGNLAYSSDNKPIIGENATVYGETYEQSTFETFIGGSSSNSNVVLDYVIAAVTVVGTALVILLLINFFKPAVLSKEINFNFIKCLKAFGIGLLATIVSVPVIFLLFISTIFTTVSIALLFAFILALLLSTTVVIILTAIMLYNKFNKGKSKLFVALYAALVSLVYYGLTLIPFAGGIIGFIISMVGFGFILSWLFGIRKANKLEKNSDTGVSTKVTEKKSKTLNNNNKAENSKKAKNDTDSKE